MFVKALSFFLLTPQVTLSDVSIEGQLTVLEVQIESFSMATVCGLHYAVLRRIQVGKSTQRTASRNYACMRAYVCFVIIVDVVIITYSHIIHTLL